MTQGGASPDPDKLLVDTKKPSTFWSQAWAWIKKAGRALLAPLPALILVVVAFVLIVLGVKNLQLGGLLGKLLGKDKPKGQKAIDKANSIPEDRVDEDGNVIPIGKPDSKGIKQAKVVEIERPGVFDRDDQVKILDGDKPVVVDLPDGVKAKDVDKVVIVSPKVYAVTVKDSSKVTGTDVDDLLAKYGD